MTQMPRENRLPPAPPSSHATMGIFWMGCRLGLKEGCERDIGKVNRGMTRGEGGGVGRGDGWGGGSPEGWGGGTALGWGLGKEDGGRWGNAEAGGVGGGEG